MRMTGIVLMLLIFLIGCSEHVFAAETESGTAAVATTENLNEDKVQRVTDHLSGYWRAETEKFEQNQRNSPGYKETLKFVNVCKRIGPCLIAVSMIAGIVLRLVAGLNKMMRRIGVLLTFGVPTLILFFMFAIPLLANAFYY